MRHAPGPQPPIPRGPGMVTADMWLDVYQQNQLTRMAGGRSAGAARPTPKRLVVDVREFMSALPAVLHQQASACCAVRALL